VSLDHLLNAAIEFDIEAVCDGEQVAIVGIMQHIEQCGEHSGHSAPSLPPYSRPADVQDERRQQVKQMALELGVIGLMNTQLAYQDGKIYVIEVNPRASRTVPFVSKCIGVSLAKVAARCQAGTSLADQGFTKEIIPDYFSVKEAVFPFNKFPAVDPILGPEMKSTGEVMGIGETFGEAYGKSQLGANNRIATGGTVFISVRDMDKPGIVDVGQQLAQLGFKIVATRGTAAVLTDAGLDVQIVNKVQEGRPHIVDMIKNDEIAMIINTVEGRQATRDSSSIRRNAENHRVYYTTTLAAGEAVCMALKVGSEIQVRRLQDLHQRTGEQ